MTPAKPRPQPADKLRVGYFSVNFHDHANLFLTSGMFAHHDRQHFEINAYALAAPRPSALRDNLAANVSAFHQVHDLSEGDIAGLARKHGLDIAIDLDGYTQNARTGIFAHRAAPIQINYLGFPGTMGAGLFDYMVADDVLIPPEMRGFYDEKILFMPNTYQPTDNSRTFCETLTSRRDFGLPEDAFVICCFNNSNKIGPAEFDIWMRVLSKVDNAVLWLLESNALMTSNLRRAAQERGVSPERLHFAPRVSQAEHLERHRHADIFADTFHYNAHTSASDALWSGLPVLTVPGQQFAARVGASLLGAVGLPELIAETQSRYEEMLMHYAIDADARKAVTAKLAAVRQSSALFDTARYARDLEAGLQQIVLRHRAGQPPKDIRLPT
ncbi:O-linked N-acetylglucosamine transferase, SPINDLY family protein [Pseudosulfitobacter koreensis]|uniref:O-linked N-acetylglucosamine transferase, SPINDLY family protein n=1 Tax=Pseudosulfitobacter koreensis TaxID=2968472 RepID=UPI0038CD3D7E